MEKGTREWLQFGTTYLGIILAVVLVTEVSDANRVLDWMYFGLPVFVLLGALSIWKVPQWQTRHLARNGVDDKDRHQLADANRRTIMQMLAGVFLIVGVYNTVETLNVARDQRTIAEQSQITDRFAKAIEQLGASDEYGEPRMELRLGAIFSLERIAQDSPRDHWTIREVLTEYVRRHAPRKEGKEEVDAEGVDAEQGEGGEEEREPAKEEFRRPRSDIQAILTVLGRRQTEEVEGRNELARISLRWTNLRGTDLRGANLSGADLRGANLSGANLRESDLRGADLRGANLCWVDLSGANLRRADLTSAQMRRSNLIQSELIRATLIRADLRGAFLREADLSGADLRWTDNRGADFSRATLSRVDLRWGDLGSAYLSQANLSEVNLSAANLSQANLDEVNLRGAMLSGADLSGAYLGAADLRGVNLGVVGVPVAVGVSVVVGERSTGGYSSVLDPDTGAYVVDPGGVRNLTQDQIDLARGNAETKLPKGLSGPAHWEQ